MRLLPMVCFRVERIEGLAERLESSFEFEDGAVRQTWSPEVRSRRKPSRPV